MIDKKKIANFFQENFPGVPMIHIFIDEEGRIQIVANVSHSEKIEILEKYLEAASNEEIDFHGAIT